REAMPFDGYELPDELRMLRDVVADFVANEIRPVEAGVPPDARELPAEERVTLQKKARDAGFWCFEAPAQFGGAGLSTFEMCVVLEAASKHRYAFPRAGDGVFGRTPPVVLYNAGQEKIERYVPPA